MITDIKSVTCIISAPDIASTIESVTSRLVTNIASEHTVHAIDAVLTASVAGWFSEHYGVSVVHSSTLSPTCSVAREARVMLDQQLVRTVGGLRGMEWASSIHVAVYVIANNIHILIRYEVV